VRPGRFGSGASFGSRRTLGGGRPARLGGEVLPIPTSAEISPELVLVDPELAARVRPTLPLPYEQHPPRARRPAPPPPRRPLSRRRIAAEAGAGALLVAAGLVSAALLTGVRSPHRTAGTTTVAPASAAAVQSVLFARLGRVPGTAQFVDPATGLPSTNTSVHCLPRPGSSVAFTCVVSSASGARRVIHARLVDGVVRFGTG
jgi:hypothetical protein